HPADDREYRTPLEAVVEERIPLGDERRPPGLRGEPAHFGWQDSKAHAARWRIGPGVDRGGAGNRSPRRQNAAAGRGDQASAASGRRAPRMVQAKYTRPTASKTTSRARLRSQRATAEGSLIPRYTHSAVPPTSWVPRPPGMTTAVARITCARPSMIVASSRLT